MLGNAASRLMLGCEEPRLALLNVGSEQGKGPAWVRAARDLICARPELNCDGFIEAHRIFSGDADVIVTDGFTGNVVLKEAEGLASALFKMLKRELMGSVRTKLGAALAKPAFYNVKKTMDYTEYGGAPLLGINGGIIKAHGSSDAHAFVSAIGQAVAYVKGGVTEKIAQGIAAIGTEEV